MKTSIAQKPMYEKVLPNDGASWRYVLYTPPRLDFNWHYHPEYELTLTLGSRGLRYIGDCIAPYSDGDLVLMGPSLPHTWCSDPEEQGADIRVHVAQIPALWVEQLVEMPELQSLRGLLDRSRRGLAFSAETVATVLPIFLAAQQQSPAERLCALMHVLQVLDADRNAQSLSSAGYTLNTLKDSGLERIEKVIQYIHGHFTDDLNAEQMARHAHMSVSHFHRFIKQRTEQTFNELVTSLRIGKACALLINSNLPVSTVCHMCGFNNLANFNRRFLQLKGLQPSAFRRCYGEGGAWAGRSGTAQTG